MPDSKRRFQVPSEFLCSDMGAWPPSLDQAFPKSAWTRGSLGSLPTWKQNKHCAYLPKLPSPETSTGQSIFLRGGTFPFLPQTLVSARSTRSARWKLHKYFPVLFPSFSITHWKHQPQGPLLTLPSLVQPVLDPPLHQAAAARGPILLGPLFPHLNSVVSTASSS